MRQQTRSVYKQRQTRSVYKQRQSQREVTLKNHFRDRKSGQLVKIDTSYAAEHLKKGSNSVITALFRCKVENSRLSGDV